MSRKRKTSSSPCTRHQRTDAAQAEREFFLWRALEGAFPIVLDFAVHGNCAEIVTESCDPIVLCADAVCPERLVNDIRPAVDLLHATYRVAHLSISPATVGRTAHGALRLLNVETMQPLGTPILGVASGMVEGFVAADILQGVAVAERRLDWYAVGATAAWLKTGMVPFRSTTDDWYHRLCAIHSHRPCLSSLALFMELPDLPPSPFLMLLVFGVSREDGLDVPYRF